MKVKVKDLVDDVLDWAVAKCLRHDQESGFSTDWAKSGHILEKHITLLEDVDSDHDAPERWRCEAAGGYVIAQYGPTPLVAICRAYISSQCGEYIEIPDELVARLGLCEPDPEDSTAPRG